MNVVCDLSLEDVMAFQNRLYRTQPEARKTMRFLRYGFTGLLVVLWDVTLVDPKIRGFFCLVLVTAVLWLLFIRPDMAYQNTENTGSPGKSTCIGTRGTGHERGKYSRYIPAGPETFSWNGIIKNGANRPVLLLVPYRDHRTDHSEGYVSE